ncbi:methyl-accepting chemotaxis protein [Sinisalibacter aestuarii]|uniref:HAMP domain-containing protein n=1 Tax=Sinisalibacter aestuarii TaxID=2949426 RepID=A0ABQ5LSI7_9RHOB|nr:methyl-accepting chemotaxis protein [Sinisalibacter aestuarii]GKY87703.1 hypothetical protein STA1M1_15720 [Sinisalibacter aestuarii]
MAETAPNAGRFRWNSIFVRLGLLVAGCAICMAGLTSWAYSRSSARLVETEIARTGAAINGLLTHALADAVMARAAGPVQREFDVLVEAQEADTRFALALDAQGAVLSAQGTAPADEAALTALARRAMAAGQVVSSGDGLMIAQPVLNAITGAASGAIATSWTAEFALAEATRLQRITIAAVSLAILLAAAAMMAVFHRWVTRPMEALAQSVDRMADDDLTVRLDQARRQDELGDIGRALRTLCDRLVTSRTEARENRFRGTAFASSSAALMMVDADLRITSMNRTLQDILTRYAEDFRRVTPDFDPARVLGQEMDTFHTPELRARVRAILLDPAQLPYKADLAIGDVRFALVINRVVNMAGEMEGFVVEWNDVTTQFMNRAILSAIDANQVKAEFCLDGSLLNANDHFAACLDAPLASLPGRTRDDLFVFGADPAGDSDNVVDRVGSGESVFGTFRVRRADGSEGVIDGGFIPVFDARKRLLRVVLIGTDRTGAHHALAQAEAARHQMQEAQARVVDTLRNGLESLAGGDLTNRIAEAFPQEYERLRDDFNLALDRLQDAMRGVVDNAELIRGEASEISSAADDLSARTERQAATPEQTASALDQLTSSVKSAADGAAHVSELVETARENAVSSGAVVREAVEAMGEIESSSQQISKITGVIDDIAFQTNLLALNAGVEAARAGEAGRGFAVVASEVRALAQRSSEAAREINALISASGGQVRRGVDLVDQAGAALKGIVDSVKEISRNVSEIAVSSREQSAGLAEINEAVNQLDQVTQQNAAMFEETTAASHALTREAETLTATMAQFQTGAAPRDRGNVVEAEFSSRRSAPAPEAQPAILTAGGVPAPEAPEDDGWDEF